MPVALELVSIQKNNAEQKSEGEAMPSDTEFGCVFCRTGQEEEVARRMEHDYPGLKAVVAMKKRFRRSQGVETEEKVILFPGYVFFQCSPDSNIREITKRDNVYKLLTDGGGNWKLLGADKVIASHFVTCGGVIGFSKAYYKGERIRIIDGFLKQYEGNIVRVNHRAKTAQVKVQLDGKCFSIWVGFEIINTL